MFIAQQELQALMEKAKPYAENGNIPDYIPALHEMDENLFGIVIRKDNEIVAAGDADHRFTLQSASKVISLALALMDKGEEVVFKKVGMEPTGDPFNTIQALEEEEPSKPLNPMINAGAIAVTSLIAGSPEEKKRRLLDFVRELADNNKISICEKTAQSEWEHSDLNKALSYFMKSHNVIHGHIDELLDVYIKQCSIQVNCKELARIGSVIGGNGKDPVSGRQLIPPRIAAIIKTFMVTCGMYNASGEFAIRVGIPAKSGVSGALLGAHPNGIGFGIISPPLNEYGNSAAGIKVLEEVSQTYTLSIFS
ncbi:L-glutaminase [Alteribacillus persepolensis]|uniref:Glutaminase n=1 Tax=Alteribacillus persepolensis TaxID=568899 RepID=A0A1G7YAS5_9BACI|nr:glutaminase A [Alteribacillus persepolensis]SDG93561.1 L-glutaminase [Alteribacillus persepolensis]